MAASQQSYYGPPPAQYGPQSTGQSHWGEMVPGQSMGSSVKYNITAFARNIPKMDGLLGKADPYLVVSVGSGPSKKQIFKSEVVRNDLNPSWRPFTIDATEVGGESVPLTWEAFDWDEDGGHDFIGSFTATLQQVSQQNKFVFMNPGRKSTFGKSKPESGDFHIANCTRAIGAAKVIPRAIRFVFRGEKLAKKDIGSSDPFLVIWASPLPSASGLPADQVAAAPRPAGPRPQAIIAKTEVIQKNLNPTWQPLDIHLELTGGLEAPMTIICYDFDDDGGHDEIGRCIVSLKDLTQPDPLIPLLDPKKKASVIHPNSGVLRVTTFEEIHGPPDPKPLAFDLSISMKKLARMDFGGLGKSDPFIQISARVPSKQKEGKAVIFKSEIITQSLSPTFKPFQLTVVDCGGLDNPLTFEVFDKDPKGQELIGGFKTTLRELSITKSNVHFLTNPNHHSRYSGIVIINSCVPSSTIVPQGVFSHAYTVKCGGKTMDRSTNSFSIFAGSKSGPLLHKSNVVRDSKNPVFETFTLDTAKCDGLDGALYFEFSDPAATGGKSSFVGGFTTTLRELNMWKTSPIIPIIDPSRVGLGYKSSGDFLILDVQPAATPAHSPHDPHAASSSQWGGAPQWGAPPGGAPPPGHWGAPPGGAPPTQWGPPPGGAPPGQWSAPPSQWGPPPGGAPPGQWSAPPSQWGPPPGQWGAPPGGAPPSQWGPPPSQWGPPPSQWGPPPSQWGPPAGGPPPGQWGPPPGGAPPGSAPPGQWGPPAGGPPAAGGQAPSQWGPPPGGAPPGQWGPPAGGPPAAGGPAPSQWGAAPPGGAPPGQWGPPPGGAPPGQWGPPAGGPPPAGSPSPSQWGPPPSGGTPPPGR